jgi:hypothetical protein
MSNSANKTKQIIFEPEKIKDEAAQSEQTCVKLNSQ